MVEAEGGAEALEKGYSWLEASRAHERALQAIREIDFLRRGEVQERIGYCVQRAAAQAESRDEFRGLMGQVAEAYGKAAKLYEVVGDAKSQLQRCFTAGR